MYTLPQIVLMSVMITLIGGGSTITTTIIAESSASGVLDLNFVDLAEAVQAHSFLAVAFYAPGCGHCRRLLPSWTQAAELLEGQDLPIRLARMDVSSRGGMLAWKEFGLTRVPAVKVGDSMKMRPRTIRIPGKWRVDGSLGRQKAGPITIFVDHDVDGPLPYTGHLDARGIAAHLSMVDRDRRRLREHRDKYGMPHARREAARPPAALAGEGAFSPEPEGSALTYVMLCSGSSSSVVKKGEEIHEHEDGGRGKRQQEVSSLTVTSKLRDAVGHRGLSVVLFIDEDSPKARRMVAELRKAAPRLAESDPPTRAVRVDLQPPGGGRTGAGTGARKPGGHRGSTATSDPAAASTKRRLAADMGVHLGNGPDLRIFVDGNPWVDGGIFRGMPTADGIAQHMTWVAMEVDLPSKNEL